MTLAGPGQPGGERRPPSSPTIPHGRRSDPLRLLSWAKSDLPRLSAQALIGKRRGGSEIGRGCREKRAGERARRKGGNVKERAKKGNKEESWG